MTTALILLPLLGAVLVWVTPVPRGVLAPFAFLVALTEVALWITALGRFDFGAGGLQLDQRTSWFGDLSVSYHAGLSGFSLSVARAAARGASANEWVFLGFPVAFAVKAPLFPFHGWLVDAYREAPPELAALLSGVISKAAVFGFLRIAIAKFPGPADDFPRPI